MLALVALATVLAVAAVLLMVTELRGEETGDPHADRREDRPVSIPMTPELTGYGRQVRERSARMCEWLGMSPDRVFRCDDGDPDRYGRVEIRWQSAGREAPTRGVVTWTGALGAYGEPTIYAGRLTLDHEQAAVLAEVAGPPPHRRAAGPARPARPRGPPHRRRPRLADPTDHRPTLVPTTVPTCLTRPRRST